MTSAYVGRMLIILGAVIVIVGLLATVVPRFPALGRLPGDIVIRRGNFTLYLPLVTSIIASIILTLIFTLFAGIFTRR